MDILIPKNVTTKKGEIMELLTKKEMYEIEGGSIPAPFINAITKAVGLLYSIGQSAGSSLRRVVGGNYCPM
jgi:hypothetical protein